MPTKQKAIAGSIAILVACFIADVPAIRSGYIWDDNIYVWNNPLLSAPDGLYRIWFTKESPSQYFPMTYTSFYIEHSLWGNIPAGYHIDNIVLHIINALLLWLLLSKLSIPLAFFAAAIFALHPVQVESVAWITERKNLLSTLFYLLAIWSWLKFNPKSFKTHNKFYFLALFFHALALFAKTTACTLPAALILVRWLKEKKVCVREWLLVLPFLLMGIAMGLVTIWWEMHHQGTRGMSFEISSASKLLIASRAIWFYLGKIIWPFPLIFSYPHWEMSPKNLLDYRWLAGLVVLAGVLFQRWRAGQKWPALAALFFVAALSPMLGFIKLWTFKYSYVADHYQYLACVAPIAVFCAALSHSGARFKSSILIPRLLPGALCIVFGYLTWQQCHIYKNEETCWRDTIAKNSESWMGYGNLGVILVEQGKIDEAIENYRKSLRINPQSDIVHNDFGLALAKQGKIDEAIDHYKEALRIDPRFSGVYNNLGNALAKQGKISEAIEQFKEVLRIKPFFIEAYNNLGITLAEQGKIDEAIEHFKKALEINPFFLNAQKNIAKALSEQGKMDEAIVHFKKAACLDPQNAGAFFDLAVALTKKGNLDEATGYFKEALRKNARFTIAYNVLGATLERQGKLDEAIEEYKKALSIDPHYAEVRNNLGVALAKQGRIDEAIEQYKMALQINPRLASAIKNLALADRILHSTQKLQ